jgi:uncharacterized protein YndB with AHSA1/START domain
MPTNKDFKRLVRGRMQKTGESYTAARAQLLKKRATPAPQPPASPAPADYARLAGMSDVAVKEKTGCDWGRWVMALDFVQAHTWSHRAIAEYVHEKYKVPDWWSQMVTVGYERIKGLRQRGQRRDGGFEATKSKTISAPVEAVYRAFADARTRRRWLPDVKVTVRTASPHKSVRMTWDDGTSVEVWLTRRGAGKSQAQVQHRRLASAEQAEERKRYWEERLGALVALLARGDGRKK